MLIYAMYRAAKHLMAQCGVIILGANGIYRKENVIYTRRLTTLEVIEYDPFLRR